MIVNYLPAKKHAAESVNRPTILPSAATYFRAPDGLTQSPDRVV
jgi:hypothetical protein